MSQIDLSQQMQARFTVAELGVDEVGSYLSEHHPDHPMIPYLKIVSGWLCQAMAEAQGMEARYDMMSTVRKQLTDMFPNEQ